MTTFEVWAPEAERVRVRVGGRDLDLESASRGWWRRDVPEAGPGTDYAYLLDDARRALPDPRSRWQPGGVHRPSRVYDHDAFTWTDQHWRGRVHHGGVLYELHIGTFTPEGTFDAAIERLDHLVDLGVDLVEVLPVNAFNGTHNWGYDGVCWYAVHEAYGGPDGLKRFVDACHARGLGVVLDAVYNHFGPSGAYPQRFGPYLTQGRNTWGRSLNLDGPGSEEVRRYIIDSALAWLRDYHVDGLRLDAVHALVDRRAVHLLEDLAVEVESLATHVGRPLTLIAESDLNDPRMVTAREAGGHGLTAQWDDDIHHALHAVLTGERQGWYADFGSLECLASVLRTPFWHTGTFSSYRRRAHGRPVDVTRVPGHRFVAYLQNHDQIGNRAQGDRLPALLSPGLLAVGATLLLTGPYTPMLFMGEEWSAATPWQFFTSHPQATLASTVAAGRLEEFVDAGWPAGDVPDPQDPETFTRSKLDWDELSRSPHKEMLDLYRRLIALRRAWPDLSDPWLDRVEVWHGKGWIAIRRGRCVVAANLASRATAVPLPGGAETVLLATKSGVNVTGESVRVPAESAAVLRAG